MDKIPQVDIHAIHDCGVNLRHRNIPFETMKCRWVFAALKSLMAKTAGCCQPGSALWSENWETSNGLPVLLRKR